MADTPNNIAKTIILKDAEGNYVIPYTEKQDKLTAGDNITITNDIIDVKPLITFRSWES